MSDGSHLAVWGCVLASRMRPSTTRLRCISMCRGVEASLRRNTSVVLYQGGAPIPPFRGRRFQPPRETHRVNRKILAREVRVIGDEGKQLGIMPTHIACRIAEEKGLDLVEVNPKGQPPVCKIIDHGKFKYEEAKKKRASKKRQTIVQVKEVKVRPKTDKHDVAVRVRSTLRFLSEGNKAKLVVQFRGREVVHPETGKAVLAKILQEVGEYAVVEQMPVMEGRRMTMLIAPKPGVEIPKRLRKGETAEDELDDELEDDELEDDALEDDALEDDALEDDALEDDALDEGEEEDVPRGDVAAEDEKA
ncbi:MAG: translation initiation factor IF-3 [Proteobacteria bacterium]|nr:MAG: translation initiation factor IF-3 [Pseudomonadota bacterium]